MYVCDIVVNLSNMIVLIYHIHWTIFFLNIHRDVNEAGRVRVVALLYPTH